jgi:hypothetical protein
MHTLYMDSGTREKDLSDLEMLITQLSELDPYLVANLPGYYKISNET